MALEGVEVAHRTGRVDWWQQREPAQWQRLAGGIRRPARLARGPSGQVGDRPVDGMDDVAVDSADDGPVVRCEADELQVLISADEARSITRSMKP
jgi:hypothetical protein